MRQKRLPCIVLVVATGLLLATPAPQLTAAPAVGANAPELKLPDIDGKERTLAEFRGRYVVLEWVNFACPFVKKHYDSGNMQRLQQAFTAKNVVWISICSSAKEKQGYFVPDQIRSMLTEKKAVPSAYLIDQAGEVGKRYSAKTTPHIFIIDPNGILIYAGAIDDKASTDLADIPKAKNFVRAVLDAALAGEKVPVTSTTPYGCSVKY